MSHPTDMHTTLQPNASRPNASQPNASQPNASQPNADMPAVLLECQDVIDLLPWFLNGSMESLEQEEVLTHLETCPRCREELEATASAASMFSQHIPSLTLAEYAQGLEPSDVSREQLESHLASCSSCREEFALASADKVVDFVAARRRLRPSFEGFGPGTLRRLIAAASLAAVVAAGSFLVRSVPVQSDVKLAENPAGHEVGTSSTLEEPQNSGVISMDGFESQNFSGWSKVQHGG